MSIRVLVTGGRDYTDAAKVNAILDRLHAERQILVVIHGAARGADALAAQWARSTADVREIACPADWGKHGRAGGPIRNSAMLADHKPDLVVAFKGGKGTQGMVKLAREANIEVMEVA